jgi:hypothetical protein
MRNAKCNRTAAFAATGALLAWSANAVASLSPSETEQVRHEVSMAQNVEHVRAIVARPDLTSDEASAVMAAAMAETPVDLSHAEFLRDLVFGSPSAASRPILAVAVVRGLLARADALLARNAKELEKNALVVGELARAYGLVEDIVAADVQANMTDSARAECAHLLSEHVARNAVLQPEQPVTPSVATVRAQAAIALLDGMPDTPGRRVDVANGLALTGARRAALIELGMLVLDSGGPDARVAALRPLLQRLPGAREGAEAIVVGDKNASRLHARGGAVVMVDAAPAMMISEARSPWGEEVAPPPIDEATLALVRDLATAAVQRALEVRPQLRAAVEHDGGEFGVPTMAAMLEVDAARTMDAAAARMLAGKRESVAWLSDALGALAVFSPSASPSAKSDGLMLPLGRAEAAGNSTVRPARVSLDASGAAATVQMDSHTWRIGRDDKGAVTGLWRDAAPVTAKMLSNLRPSAQPATSWNVGGTVFARLAGSPRATLTAGPHVWVYGSGVPDAIATPSPADDVVVEADLRVNGGPGGIAVRALPGSFRSFKGVSLMIVPGPTPHAALLVSDGRSVETAAAPIVELTPAPVQHVRLAVKGQKVEARVGTAKLEAALPDGYAHGDVALRAYSDASVEATGWNLRKQ